MRCSMGLITSTRAIDRPRPDFKKPTADIISMCMHFFKLIAPNLRGKYLQPSPRNNKRKIMNVVTCPVIYF